MKRNLKVALLITAAALLVAGAFSIAGARKYKGSDPWIGVYLEEIDRDLRELYNLESKDGALVMGVIDDSPADEAGLRKKDVIIEFNGKTVTDPDELIDWVDETEIGQEIKIVFIRKGEQKEATVKIAERPEDDRDFLLYRGPRSFSKYKTFRFHSDDYGYIGVSIQNLSEQLGEYFGVKGGEGVLITEVFEDSPAEAAGLKAGDVIIDVDGEQVAVTSDLQDIISDHEEGDTVEITYLRRGSKATAKVEVEEGAYLMDSYALPAVPAVPKIPAIPKVPDLKWYGHDNWDDHEIILERDFFDSDEFEKEMDDLRDELEEMRNELKELRSLME